jgi:VanZ family protein
MMLRYLWPAMLWSVVVLVLTLIPGEVVPDVDIVNIDKVVHFFIFGVLMIATAYGLLKTAAVKGYPAKPVLIATLYSISFGIAIEFIQRFVPGRSFSVFDMIANTIGVGIGYLVVMFVRKRMLIKE